MLGIFVVNCCCKGSWIIFKMFLFVLPAGTLLSGIGGPASTPSGLSMSVSWGLGLRKRSLLLIPSCWANTRPRQSMRHRAWKWKKHDILGWNKNLSGIWNYHSYLIIYGNNFFQPLIKVLIFDLRSNISPLVSSRKMLVTFAGNRLHLIL